MPLDIELAAYFTLSLVIMGLSILAKNSISVVLAGCALGYVGLWWPRQQYRLIAPSRNIQ